MYVNCRHKCNTIQWNTKIIYFRLWWCCAVCIIYYWIWKHSAVCCIIEDWCVLILIWSSWFRMINNNNYELVDHSAVHATKQQYWCTKTLVGCCISWLYMVWCLLVEFTTHRGVLSLYHWFWDVAVASQTVSINQ